MRIELEAEGYDVHFLSLNKADAADHQAKLTSRCSFPLFQDLDEVGAWGLHGGRKDDFFIFDAQGVLTEHMTMRDDVRPVLSEDAGYARVKDAAIAAASAPAAASD
jgi:hypothetical protein